MKKIARNIGKTTRKSIPMIVLALVQACLEIVAISCLFSETFAFGSPLPVLLNVFIGTASPIIVLGLYCFQAELFRRAVNDEPRKGAFFTGIEKHAWSLIRSMGIILIALPLIFVVTLFLESTFSIYNIGASVLSVLLTTLTLPILLCIFPVSVLEGMRPIKAFMQAFCRGKSQFLPCLVGIVLLSILSYGILFFIGLALSPRWSDLLSGVMIIVELVFLSLMNAWAWIVCAAKEEKAALHDAIDILTTEKAHSLQEITHEKQAD